MGISTWGWGSIPCQLIPIILAEYFGDSKAYSCVATREYIEIKSREKGVIVLRVRPDNLSLRQRLEFLERISVDVGSRTFIEIMDRVRDDIVLRVKPEEISERELMDLSPRQRQEILDRVKTEIIQRSEGWPRESGEICED